jgi:hypothetical protein
MAALRRQLQSDTPVRGGNSSAFSTSSPRRAGRGRRVKDRISGQGCAGFEDRANGRIRVWVLAALRSRGRLSVAGARAVEPASAAPRCGACGGHPSSLDFRGDWPQLPFTMHCALQSTDRHLRLAFGSGRSLRGRLLSLAVAAAIAAAWSGDALALHDCSHHDLGIAPGGAGHGEESHEARGAGESHSAFETVHHPPPEVPSSHDDHGEGACHCWGECTGAVSMAIARVASVHREFVRSPRGSIAAFAPSTPRTTLAYVLPWSTAPPSA